MEHHGIHPYIAVRPTYNFASIKKKLKVKINQDIWDLGGNEIPDN